MYIALYQVNFHAMPLYGMTNPSSWFINVFKVAMNAIVFLSYMSLTEIRILGFSLHFIYAFSGFEPMEQIKIGYA